MGDIKQTRKILLKQDLCNYNTISSCCTIKNMNKYFTCCFVCMFIQLKEKDTIWQRLLQFGKEKNKFSQLYTSRFVTRIMNIVLRLN